MKDRGEFNILIGASDGGIFQTESRAKISSRKTEGLLGWAVSKRQRTCGSET